MVQKLILGEKIYSYSPKPDFKPLLAKYKQMLSHEMETLDVGIKKIDVRDEDNRLELLVEGPDEEFLKSLLKEEFGSTYRFLDVREGDILKGYVVEVGKVGFGVFVDCGVKYPTTDVLINLITLRNQLCKGKKIPLRKIVDSYGLIENFPIYIEIEEISRREKNLRGKIAKKSLDMINNWIKDDLERVFVSGSTRAQVKKAMSKTGHSRDIVSLKKLGFLENIIILKEGTNAPGIISHIGKKLEYSKLSAIRPLKIEEII